METIIGKKCLAFYQTCKRNREVGYDGTKNIDEIVITMWEALNESAIKLNSLEKELDETKLSNAQLFSKLDIAETKLQLLANAKPEFEVKEILAASRPEATKDTPNAVRVTIIESESGWGTKVDDVKYFYTKAEAEEFCKEFNKDNPTDRTPEWYMLAYVG